MIRMNYNVSNIWEYLPVRYEATTLQKIVRSEIYRFKDGFFSQNIKNELVSHIRSITGDCPSDWVVAFIPASSAERTRTRFYRLSQELSAALPNVRICFNAISNAQDRPSTMVTGKIANPAEFFAVNSNAISGKKVLLIDDVITTGRSFQQTANKVMACGARSVEGLFLAKTINPDWNN